MLRKIQSPLIQYRFGQPTMGSTISRPPKIQSEMTRPTMIQSLESRQLLSAVLTNGVLTVTGTAKNDAIVVSLSTDGTTLTVSERAAKRFKKTTATKTTFTTADVTSILVNAGAGNDNVSLMGNKTTDFTIPSTLNGEDGDDRLSGGNGADTINGGAGDDDLFGNGGADLLNGGDGDDLLVGGKGIDTLNGDAGDDLLKSAGDSEVDILDGGTDSAAAGATDEDQAIIDSTETATNATVITGSDLPIGPGGPGGDGDSHGPGHGGPGSGGDCPTSSSSTGNTGSDSSSDSSSGTTSTAGVKKSHQTKSNFSSARIL